MNLRKICEAHLPGQYTIEVINLLETPQLARDDRILALPTVVRRLPAPVKRMVGDLSDAERVRAALSIGPVA
jgi:circadian clock protein KaiB